MRALREPARGYPTRNIFEHADDVGFCHECNRALQRKIGGCGCVSVLGVPMGIPSNKDHASKPAESRLTHENSGSCELGCSGKFPYGSLLGEHLYIDYGYQYVISGWTLGTFGEVDAVPS